MISPQDGHDTVNGTCQKTSAQLFTAHEYVKFHGTSISMLIEWFYELVNSRDSKVEIDQIIDSPASNANSYYDLAKSESLVDDYRLHFLLLMNNQVATESQTTTISDMKKTIAASKLFPIFSKVQKYQLRYSLRFRSCYEQFFVCRDRLGYYVHVVRIQAEIFLFSRIHRIEKSPEMLIEGLYVHF